MRLAIVGQRTYFDYCALQEPAHGVEPRFVDYRAGADVDALVAAIDDFAPDVVFVFRPEIIPAGAFADRPFIACGFLTEPLPRPGRPSHPDLEIRFDELRPIDPDNFDRIICFDPIITPTVEQLVPVWRTFPIPVADRYFADVAPPRSTRKVIFTGRSTDHREWLLGPAKHDFEVAHLAHGVTDERLIEFMAESDVGINLHNENYPTFENRVCVYLAAGLLLITEPLSPTHGLVPGSDFVEIRNPEELWYALDAFAADAEAFRPMRLAARRKAERFRASEVYPRIVRDLVRDVETFGRSLPNSPSSRSKSSISLA